MMRRFKWDVVEPVDLLASPWTSFHPEDSSPLLQELIAARALTAHFQPIFSAKDGAVFGCEALARVDPKFAPQGIAPLFASAREHGLVAPLDRLCRQAALECAAVQEFAARSERLFVNVCPETLMEEGGEPVAALVERLGLPRERIIFEVTEESAVQDYDLFARAIAFYRDQGFQIAIDDFGVGYGGLKMLAVIEPDYVKIDRHFIKDIERANVRRNLVDAIATVCHRLGIKVVAEGVENEADASVLLDMGVEFLQGFGLARPTPLWPEDGVRVALPRASCSVVSSLDHIFIGDIARPMISLPPSAPMSEARRLFIDNAALTSLPLVHEECCTGMLHRRIFFEQQLSGPFGYGTALSTHRSVLELSQNAPFVCVEASETLEDVARSLQHRHLDSRSDDICVTSNGKYRGTVSVSALLEAIMQRSLLMARGSNPLSGLPGNEALHHEIEKRIAQMMHFDVCYLDIDHFKPFNDVYGFDKGDTALHHLVNSITRALAQSGDADDFAGHIGGDDFIVLTRPQRSISLCREIIADFEAALPQLHGETDFAAGSYQATNRRGQSEIFSLMALSIGIVSTEVNHFDSVAELASMASEVKKAAKSQCGSSVVRDQRLA
ncbi:diguanylate cyclase (GGDEF) domain-containing protein [Abditibacterium utsteinense]|uniref:Diguanylate cyclase (GGDEF) domain-containing protein n=1 Tax=Abditibacterium utsteinense TaxID=1960156 RepID=A0A2S8SP09_9BACT|nr:bifunctional diguanylate cyclase/phosphodiesterase [Abditibacterium utsteinense]PQV62535.1 diguanylate cyclase (GGDEF) domain-containing protein [Abditibacterium utsteinense]